MSIRTGKRRESWRDDRYRKLSEDEFGEIRRITENLLIDIEDDSDSAETLNGFIGYLDLIRDADPDRSDYCDERIQEASTRLALRDYTEIAEQLVWRIKNPAILASALEQLEQLGGGSASPFRDQRLEHASMQAVLKHRPDAAHELAWRIQDPNSAVEAFELLWHAGDSTAMPSLVMRVMSELDMERRAETFGALRAVCQRNNIDVED